MYCTTMSYSQQMAIQQATLHACCAACKSYEKIST